MHLKKNGDSPIPPIAWKMTRDAQIEASQILLDLHERFCPDESSDIAKALRDATRIFLEKASLSQQRSQLARRGRPARMVGIIDRAMSEGAKSKPKKKGRPSLRPKTWNATVYRFVEAERTRLVNENISKGTIGDAIKSLLRTRIAPLKNRSERQTVSDYFNVTRSAYNRGKRSSAR